LEREYARPLRVLIVAPSLDILGGQAVQAQMLLNKLRGENDLQVSFLPINPRLKGSLRRLQYIKFVRTLVTLFPYLYSLLVQVRTHDVIHIFSASYLSFLLAQTPAILVSRLYGKKIVLNYRSGEAGDHLRRWRTAVPTIRLVDAIVAPSGYLVDVFARFGLRARAISNVVDTNRFLFRLRRPFRPVFLSNRNLEPMYNVACIILAFARIQQRFPDARLNIAGDGSQRQKLERLVRKLALRNVRFLGRVSNELMNELYDDADIYLNSSDIDNMPGSIVEAFACGLPVATTDAGGIPYIVTGETTGLLVQRGDYQALAAAAIRLLEDQDFATRIAQNARAECGRYCWTAVGDQWVSLYCELAGRESSRETGQKAAA
jgi:glycosyltransferase involved in cell wall biosynthesis